MSSVYQINKGINKSIEFKGLRAQYIGYLAGGLVGLLILFAALYLFGVNTYLSLVLILGLGTGLISFVFKLSRKYGQYGLMKRRAKSQVPDYLRFSSRRVFRRLRKEVSL